MIFDEVTVIDLRISVIYNYGMSEKLIRLAGACPYLEAKKIKSSQIRFDPEIETQPDSVICDAGFDASFELPKYKDKGFAIVTAKVDEDFDPYIHRRAWLEIVCEGCELLPKGFNIVKQIKVS